MASEVGNENLVRFLKQQQQLNERLAEQQATFSGQTRQQM